MRGVISGSVMTKAAASTASCRLMSGSPKPITSIRLNEAWLTIGATTLRRAR